MKLNIAFGGNTFQFLENYMFFRFYAFLPLLFIGLLDYFKKKKITNFLFATAVLFLQSYYLMFPTLIFLFMFSVTIEIKDKKKIDDVLKDFFTLLLALVIGFMISAIITVPSMMYVLSNSRVGAKETGGLFWQRNVYAGLWASLTSYIPWTLDTIFKTTNGGHDNFYSLFITIIPLVSCFDYVTKKENRNELILLLVLIIFTCLKPLS